jgi:hypothetical protein
MDSSIQADDSSNGDAGSQVCVTLDSLSIDGQAPQVGDQVDLHGTVASIKDGNAYVKVDNSMDDSGGSSDDGSALRSQLDQSSNYQ